MSSSLDDFLNGKVKIELNDAKQENSTKSSSLDDFLNGKVKIDMSSENTSREITQTEEYLKQQQAKNIANDLIKAVERRTVKADSLADYAKQLSPERIQEIKDTSPILNPEKYHKDVDLGYYARRAAEGLSSAGESIIDTMTRAREQVSYPALKAGEFVTSLGGKYDNRVSDAFSKLLERNKEASIEAVESTPTANYAKMTDFIYNDVNGLQKLAGDVVSGGSAMLPMLAANAVVPGSGYAILGAQGYGSGIQQAYQKTGELGLKEDMYGLLSGLSEIAIEKISGGIGGLGDGVVDNIASKMIKNGLIRSATGEGIEEAVSTFIDPYLQRLTYDKGAEGAKASEVLRSAIVGALTSMLLQGGSTAINSLGNLPQNIQQNKQNREEIRNSLVGLENMLPNYENVSETASAEKNVASELPTNELQQPMQQTNQTEGKTAQNGNIEQIAKNEENGSNTNEFGQQIDDLLAGKRNKKDSLVVLPNTPKILQELGAEDLPITVTSGKLERIMNAEGKQKKQYHDLGIDIVKQLPEALNRPLNILKSHDNSYVVVTDLADKQDRTIIASIKIDGTGRLDNVEILSNVMTSAYGRNGYDSYMQRNIAEGNMVYDIDEGIIKENLNDGARLQLSRTTNEVSNNIVNQNDNFVNTPADTQSAFSMSKNYIDPSQDIQKATEFVSKATVEDIDTLNKMVEEAEKHPDRVDLQFFAEKAKKRIEYLTKSQKYLINKVENFADKLNKQYGLNKEEVKKEIRKYANSYKNEDGKFTKGNLLNNLNAENILPESELNSISNEIDKLNSEIDTVKRYEIEKTKNEETVNQSKQYSRINTKAISELYALKKQYQENSDRAMRDVLLTKSDSIQLDRLLKGEITFDELPKNVNVEQIRKAYDAKKPLVDVSKDIQLYNKAKKQKRFDAMKELTKNSAQWKDKKVGFWYARETQERNISDIAPEEDATRIKKEIFEPIHHNEAEATRYKNALRDKIQELKIDLKPKYEVTYNDSQGTKTEKVSESGLVQLYGEKKINDETLEKLNVDIKKIKTAVETFRQIYNDIYNKTNEVLIENGYAPVEFRKDYFPHFEETKPDTLIGKALNKLGFKVDTRELPTDIAGITHEFRPGKKWVSNFLRRTTDVATYDAIKGFDSYIDSVADVIYHTDDIQKLRAYENALRYQHSDKVIKEQVDEIINMDAASEMKQSMIDQLYANAENSLSHYVTDLRAYTDTLAGKKSLEDRTMEHNLGRGIYNITKNVQNRVSANMVGANISSALTNFIPITQATGVIDGKYMLQSTWDMIKNSIKSDGFIEKSDFLTNRRGSDKLYKTKTDKLASATNLMSVFDNITSEIINRGRYYQNVANGMTEAEALNEANEMSGKILGDRSKGAVPTIFNQSSPMTKLLTAFQLEVNNQYSYFLKDIPNDKKDEVLGALVWAFAKVFIGAWVYNEIAERVIGRRPATDPINIITETIGDITEGKKASEVALNLGTEIVEEIPFVGGLIGGGRLPISSALPDIPETVKATLSLFEEGDKKKATQTLIRELSKPVFYIVPPFGGGQLKKTVEGLYTYSQGGNYGITSKGEKTLKYPVEQNVGNAIKSALFGKWSTPEAKDYIDRGFKPLSANQTEAYEKAMKAGITSEQFYDAYDAQRGIKGLGDLTSPYKKTKIDEVTKGLNKKQKTILYDTFDVSKEAQKSNKKVTDKEAEKQKEKLEKEKQLKAMNVKFNK